MIVELDRQKNEDGSRKTAFVEGVEYIKFYLYTSVNANVETDSVGAFKLMKDADGKVWLTDMNETVKLAVNGPDGDYYFDRISNADFYRMIAAAVGENYSATQAYYVAAQTCGKEGSVYVSSGISEIGTSVIKQS